MTKKVYEYTVRDPWGQWRLATEPFIKGVIAGQVPHQERAEELERLKQLGFIGYQFIELKARAFTEAGHDDGE